METAVSKIATEKQQPERYALCYMNKISIIFLLLLICSCNDGPKKNAFQLSDRKPSNKLENASLEGQWVLTNYFDSIIKYKSIVKFYMPPTWFAIVININNDSLTSKGSIRGFEQSIKLNNNKDSLCILDHFTGKWILSMNCRQLKLTNISSISNNEKLDPTVYTYQKNNYSELSQKNADSSNCFKYVFYNQVYKILTNRIIAGTYELLFPKPDSKRIVVFDTIPTCDNYNTISNYIKNLDNYNYYSLDTYFGTCHYFNNRDVLTLIDDSLDEHFNWVFNKDILTLTNLVPYKNYEVDGHFLGNKKIILRKIK